LFIYNRVDTIRWASCVGPCAIFITAPRPHCCQTDNSQHSSGNTDTSLLRHWKKSSRTLSAADLVLLSWPFPGRRVTVPLQNPSPFMVINRRFRSAPVGGVGELADGRTCSLRTMRNDDGIMGPFVVCFPFSRNLPDLECGTSRTPGMETCTWVRGCGVAEFPLGTSRWRRTGTYLDSTRTSISISICATFLRRRGVDRS
jgi:hypothetical protein